MQEMIRPPDIVGVEKGHEFSACFAHRARASDRNAGVALAHQIDAPIGEAAHFGRAIVGRAIVDNHNLKVVKRSAPRTVSIVSTMKSPLL